VTVQPIEPHIRTTPNPKRLSLLTCCTSQLSSSDIVGELAKRYIGNIRSTMSGDTHLTAYGNSIQATADENTHIAKTFLTERILSDTTPQTGGAIMPIVVNAALIEPICIAENWSPCKYTVENDVPLMAAQYKNPSALNL